VSSTPYATASDLRSYTGLSSTDMPDATASALLAKSERDIDSICVVDRPVLTDGRRFDPSALSDAEALALRRATCAQAEYRHVMGNDFFIRWQYRKVTGPDYTTEGTLSQIGPAVGRELAATGLARLSTTTATDVYGGRWGSTPDNPPASPRESFERNTD